jgi:choline kinase
VLGIILGGGAGSRLYPLTKKRAKPAVPLGANYRLIDIPVSNCINSGGVENAWVKGTCGQSQRGTLCQCDCFQAALLGWLSRSVPDHPHCLPNLQA